MEKGKKNFQAKYINLSYRNRGRVPRTQTKIKAITPKETSTKKEQSPPKKMTLNRKDINKILVYSANIIKANPPLLYSVL